MAESTADVIVNADQTHSEESKSIFRDALAAVQAENDEQQPIIPEKKTDAAASPVKKDDSTPVSEKGEFPDELITGEEKAKPQASDALKEIEAMELPKNAKPEQVASFKQLKDNSRKIIQEKIAIITELEQKVSGTANKAELDAIAERAKAAEARAKELEDTVERLAFEKSPRFEKQFVASEKAAVDGAKAYLAGTEINPNVIDLAMRESGPKRISMLKEAGADAETIAAISPHLAAYDSIQISKADALANWKANSTQWEQQQQAAQQQQEAARKAEEDRVFGTVIELAKSDFLPFRKVDGHAEWNAQAEKLEQEAKRIFNGDAGGLDVVAKTIAAGVAMPVMQDMFKNMQTRLNAALAENAKLKAAKPDGGLSQGAAKPKDETNMTEDERRKQAFNQNMALAQGGGL